MSGNAGAGLGLPGRAVRCSAARREKQKECTRLGICRERASSKQVVFFSTTQAITSVWPWATSTQLEWAMRNYVNYHLQAFFFELSWGNIEGLMKSRFPYCYSPSRTVC